MEAVAEITMGLRQVSDLRLGLGRISEPRQCSELGQRLGLMYRAGVGARAGQ